MQNSGHDEKASDSVFYGLHSSEDYQESAMFCEYDWTVYGSLEEQAEAQERRAARKAGREAEERMEAARALQSFRLYEGPGRVIKVLPSKTSSGKKTLGPPYYDHQPAHCDGPDKDCFYRRDGVYECWCPTPPLDDMSWGEFKSRTELASRRCIFGDVGEETGVEKERVAATKRFYSFGMYDRQPARCLSGPDNVCGPCPDGGYDCFCPNPGTCFNEPKKVAKKARKAGKRKKPCCTYCKKPMKGHPRFMCGYNYNDTYPQHYDV